MGARVTTSNVVGVHHGGITVREMDASLRFYRDGLGLEVTLDAVRDAPYLHETLAVPFHALRYVILRVPGSDGGAVVELLEYQGIERFPASSRPCDYGGGHLCLYVDDVEGMHDRLASMGYRSRSGRVVDITEGPNAGARSCYMADPDGYWIELFQTRPGA